MADITRAFENLNRSLRHISDTNRLERQSERQHEENKAKLHAELTDPRRLLKVQQAQKEMEDVGVSSQLNFGKGLFSDKWTSKRREGLGEIVSEYGAEVKGNRVVQKGTDIDFTGPRYQMRKVNEAINSYMAMSNVPSKREAFGIAQKQHQLDNIKNVPGGDLHPSIKKRRNTLQDEVDTYNTKMSDPNEQMRALNTDKAYYEEALQQAMLKTNNSMIITKLNKVLDRNVDDRSMLLKSAGLKNKKSHTYHRREQSGAVVHIKVPDSGVEANNVIHYRGKNWTLGAYTRPLKDTSGGGGLSRAMLAKKKLTQAVDKHTDILTFKLALEGKITKTNFLKNWAANQHGTPKEGELKFAEIFKTKDPEVREVIMSKLLHFENTHKTTKDFWYGRDSEYADYKKRTSAYLNKKLKNNKTMLSPKDLLDS